MSTHVMYGSQYGHAKKYAEWIAEVLRERDEDVQLIEAGRYTVSPAAPSTLVFVAGNYGGSLHRMEKFVETARSYPNARLVLLSVGMASASREDEARHLWDKNVPSDLRGRTECFHARGGVEFSRLTAKHKLVMTAVRGFFTAKPAGKRHPEDQQLLDSWGEDFDYTSRDQIEGLLDALTR